MKSVLLALLLCSVGWSELKHAFVQNAAQVVWSGEFVVEPPTLHCAGFEWTISGDANRNATVTVNYRKKGDNTWSVAHPLLRIGGEKVYGHQQRWMYTTPHMFAGSILNLEESTEYEAKFVMYDPDGVTGDSIKTVHIKTRGVPKPYADGKIYHVYPPDHSGKKTEPWFTGLNEAYYGKGNLGDWWLVPDARVEPGDIIIMHAGTYKGDRLNYVDPLALQFHGAYVLTQKGTPEKPITIKSAGDGEVILDGAGAYRLFDVMAADHHYFEGLTIRNTEIAFYAGLKNVMGCSGLTVKQCKIEDVGIAVMTHSEQSKNFYIADNIMIGRHDPDTLQGWHGFDHPAPLTSYFAVKVYGQGHVICHNDISHFHDGICIDTHGLPAEAQDQKCVSIDIYRNEIFNMSDDFIEADGGVHNIRIFENRGFNAYHAGLSAQPVFGGPTYFLRNIIYQVPGTALKFSIRPAGIFVYHNTFCCETSFVSASNSHFKNNLFMGTNDDRALISGTVLNTYCTLDHNGYNRKENAGFRWRYPNAPNRENADVKEISWTEVGDLRTFQRLTNFEQHGLMVDYGIFRSVPVPDPLRRGHIYQRSGIDFRLQAEATAVDKGMVLPSINDQYHGAGPDLGALEVGVDPPKYGPR
ncbi:MAG: hypothetical protein OEQ53_11580 [Saprospiraceae bacterium]|nr:hypothetical protein [Saprospiraceae bacterium]